MPTIGIFAIRIRFNRYLLIYRFGIPKCFNGQIDNVKYIISLSALPAQNTEISIQMKCEPVCSMLLSWPVNFKLKCVIHV